MINRVLIRIKVVQMLYSYLLTKSEFRIEGNPEKPTRDNLYAYRVYVDLLLLILKLSGQKLSPSDKSLLLSDADGKNPFAKSATALSLAKISDIREFGVRYADRLKEFNDVTRDLFDRLARQSIVTEYARKRKVDIAADVTLWTTLINTVLAKDEPLIAQFRKDEDFTIAGFNKGISLVVATLNGYSDTQSSLIGSKKALETSLDQAYLLYHALLWLPVEITRMRYDNLEAAKEKYLPTSEDLNPNMKFVDNAFVAAIRDSADMEAFFKANPFSWDTDYFLVKSLLDSILASDTYRKYMAEETSDYQSDAEFWRDLFRFVILPSDTLAEALESKSVFWNDDVQTIGTFVLKTIRRSATNPRHQLELLPEYKDDEDAKFGNELFTCTVSRFGEYKEMLDSFINASSWDPERLAFMDTVIIATALAEILNFPKIPLVVSFNEYIEIANYYSTPRSGQFVNGVLYAICNHLKEEGKLHKNFDNPAAPAKAGDK